MKIILLIALANYIVYMINKKSNILGCGLVAWCGDDTEKFNFSKINTLGVFNEKRGKHSCGATWDGEILSGVDSTKVWRDFSPSVNDSLEDYPLQIPTFIGHTRFATGGEHNVHNAHPFGYGNMKGKFEMVGAHNGSLIQIDELADEFDISSFEGERLKIDSEILLEIIYERGFEEVLSKYKGAAALIWQDLNKPDTMFIYHGKSSMYSNGYSSVEERPMYYLQEEEGSLYFSSIKESLEHINEKGGEIGELPFNKVFEIKNGNLEEAIEYDIDRSKCFQKEYANNYSNTKKANPTSKSKPAETLKLPLQTGSEDSKSKIIKSTIVNLHLEKPVVRFKTFKEEVYHNKMRYWKGGILINGIYTPLKDTGITFLGMTEESARDNYKVISNARKIAEKPFLMYYHNGICLETHLDYKAVNSNNNYSLHQLSEMSKYPVMDLKNPNSKIYFKQKWANEMVVPFGSRSMYIFNDGECVYKEEHYTRFEDFEYAILGEDKDMIEAMLGKSVFENPEKKKDPVKSTVTDVEMVTEYLNEIEEVITDAISDMKELKNSSLKKGVSNMLEKLKLKTTNTITHIWKEN